MKTEQVELLLMNAKATTETAVLETKFKPCITKCFLKKRVNVYSKTEKRIRPHGTQTVNSCKFIKD